jgi:hypothetical protein
VDVTSIKIELRREKRLQHQTAATVNWARGNNRTHPITAAAAKRRKSTAEKGIESCRKDSAWDSILFQGHNDNDLLRGGSPRKSAVAVTSAAVTAETDFFGKARGKGV